MTLSSFLSDISQSLTVSEASAEAPPDHPTVDPMNSTKKEDLPIEGTKDESKSQLSKYEEMEAEEEDEEEEEPEDMQPKLQEGKCMSSLRTNSEVNSTT